MYELLRRTRLATQALWDRVAAHNEDHPPDPEASTRVSFYVGQALETSEE